MIKRFGKATFENEKCIKCNLLPICTGPCSQKVIEVGDKSKQICSLNSLESSIEDFIINYYEESLNKRIKKREFNKTK